MHTRRHAHTHTHTHAHAPPHAHTRTQHGQFALFFHLKWSVHGNLPTYLTYVHSTAMELLMLDSPKVYIHLHGIGSVPIIVLVVYREYGGWRTQNALDLCCLAGDFTRPALAGRGSCKLFNAMGCCLIVEVRYLKSCWVRVLCFFRAFLWLSFFI